MVLFGFGTPSWRSCTGQKRKVVSLSYNSVEEQPPLAECTLACWFVCRCRTVVNKYWSIYFACWGFVILYKKWQIPIFLLICWIYRKSYWISSIYGSTYSQQISQQKKGNDGKRSPQCPCLCFSFAQWFVVSKLLLRTCWQVKCLIFIAIPYLFNCSSEKRPTLVPL